MQIMQREFLQPHGVSGVIAFAIVDDDIHLLQTAQRLAQRPCRQTKAVAETALGIHYGNLDVTLQPIVLQPVIGDYHITLTQQFTCGGDTID